MQTSETIVVAAHPADVFPHVADLGAYPAWLPLVHEARPDDLADGADGPAWLVELRAQVGPFARSKRLRMVRTDAEPERRVVFTRRELDGREHATWQLEAVLATSADGGTELTMHLAYGGRLWTGGVLERVLDDQVRQGRDGLRRVLAARST